MTAENFEILLFYKYVNLPDAEKLVEMHKTLCHELNLKGRIIIATEGINGTVEGLRIDTEKYIKTITSDKRFSDMDFKRSKGNGRAFPKISVKLRPEIVSLKLGEKDFNPNQITGKHLSAEELHQWIHSDKEFYIVDMRNGYECEVGFFEKSIYFPEMKNFRDLPKILPKLENLKNKTVVTVCTGGIRCEKASGFLVCHGFTSVYQLHNGIVTYMEKYPNEDFKGKLFVFDGRVAMGFNTEAPQHEIVGKCRLCGEKSENYVDYYPNPASRVRDYGICCEKCIEGKSLIVG